MRGPPPASLILVAALAACAPPVDGVIETHTLASTHVDQTYTLTVFEHDQLGDDAVVVYLFDGDDWTERTAGIVSALVTDGAIAPPLVVGVGYGDTPNARHRDYTPPGADIPDGHGEIEPFMAFMTQELVPWVDDGWSTADAPRDRVLLGHSFGGIAALWGLLREPAHFGAAVALSPSLTFADGTLFDEEAAYAAGNDDLDAALYLGAGSQEAYALAGLTEAFGAELAARQYPGLDLRAELHDGRTHATVFPVGAESGLAFVLGSP